MNGIKLYFILLFFLLFGCSRNSTKLNQEGPNIQVDMTEETQWDIYQSSLQPSEYGLKKTELMDNRILKGRERYKPPKDYKGLHRYDLYTSLSEEDKHVVDSDYMYNTFLAKNLENYFEKRYGKIKAILDCNDKLSSFFPIIFNKFYNDRKIDFAIDTLLYKSKSDTIIFAQIISNPYNFHGYIISSQDALAYEILNRTIRKDDELIIQRSPGVSDATKYIESGFIPSFIRNWDEGYIRNYKENIGEIGDSICLPVDGFNAIRLLRVIIKNNKIVSSDTISKFNRLNFIYQ